ncbi:DUF835 domain-containing protein [Thermococcus thioreducens]|nr:DUF835 domain-containing protein [Thermococcus thioreducens]ASJ13548.1 rubrerythrin [Thermococcus thioreducens]KQH82353.1 rubrerythrin [Thermococcus thioreducens]
MKEIVDRLQDKSPKELLSYAIFNEEEEVKYYSKLAQKAKRASIKALFIKMSEESKDHHDWLYNLFKKLYPEEEPVKVDAPPVEVAPFYPEFESVEDYLSVLEYCMESELFAKKTYEVLAKAAKDDETRVFALNLAVMEEEHYEEIRKLYELMLSLEEQKIVPATLEPGAYLFTDETKAKYFLVDLAGGGVKLYAVVREKPEKFLELFGDIDVKVLWVTKTEAKNSIRPKEIPILKKTLCDFIEETIEPEEKRAAFIQNLGYIAFELGFKSMMDVILYLKDCAILNGGYLIVTALRDAFDRREWALLTSELQQVS